MILKIETGQASKAAGIQPLIYGPAGRFLKLADEKIELKQVVTATKFLALTAADICGGAAK